MLGKIVDIFRIRKEERCPALVALSCFVMLNVLNVVRYWEKLTVVDGDTWGKFIKGWHVAGFDPITYSVLTKWQVGYNVYRHPLLAYFMWPFGKFNELLTSLTGINMAIVIAACLLTFCAFYSYIFLNRIYADIVGVRRMEANVLSLLTFSFAYIMLASMVPDHFIMSMFCLTMTLYLCGGKLRNGSALNMWQTIAMFMLTAGVSLNNGLKIFLAAMVTRRKRFFEWRFLLFAVILPSALIWGSARWSYKQFVWPKEMARHEKKAERQKRQEEKIRASVLDTIKTKDSVQVQIAVDSAMARIKARKEMRYRKSAAYRHTGEPIVQGEFMRWTDKTTSRWDVAVENLFGEGIMLHEDHLLGDVLVNRPVIVRYHNWGNYIVEGMLVALFLLGVWYGRRQLFLWTAMSFFLMDMLLHMGLGFGINEVSIMSAHYLYVLPIAIAYLLKALPDRWRRRMMVALAVVAMYIGIWNVTLIIEYLYVL
ncbi:MAG: GtrA family protein [Prevotella sp.]|nr:GtrA family protein [Prevotella sp.]